MARIRTIKPEFCCSEQVGDCSTTARLLFVTMWMFCDDGGNHPAKLMQLKAECFPIDNFDKPKMQSLVNELLAAGLIVEYRGSDGLTYWHVNGWSHQKIDKPKIKYPPYSKDSETSRDESSNGRDESRMVDAVPYRTVPEGTGTVPESTVPEGTNLCPAASQPDGSVEGVAAVVAAYQEYHPRAKPASKERKLIRARLGEGRTVDELIEAIHGCHVSPHHCGENDTGTVYQSLELIVRDAKHVDMFIECWNARGQPVLSKQSRENLRAAEAFLARGD